MLFMKHPLPPPHPIPRIRAFFIHEIQHKIKVGILDYLHRLGGRVQDGRMAVYQVILLLRLHKNMSPEALEKIGRL